ncbi:MAG TPA: putative dsRNA-binding protein [Solirubrobacterales bacterium]|nr:putative dsRNA-binding protein [Solirubrobacterales bacterium]HMY25297.1 putative dsRNA-binding protein [Solirubrobacterales bacterium]HNA23482.1 putative dsRNA-binding protein [Solirubrobacterales bacterium]HNC92635.1 putative dsRNA-binding protein [Solirubrobacterales bacterium]HNG56128.1 putative dsRNA-binding protein [Solirubrobacterales bacterium]
MSWLKRSRERAGGHDPVTPDSGLASLIEGLPEDLKVPALTHSSWTSERTDSYERLALLGDSVLGLAVADELYRTLPGLSAGALTKILNQTVSGTSCAEVGRELGIPDMLLAADPGEPDGKQTPARLLLEGERPLPEITEALIGACYLHYGFGATSSAVIEAFRPRISLVRENQTDFKSALQEEAARHGETVSYEVIAAHGPAHQRTYEVAVIFREEEIGRGEGRSKKAAGQAAAEVALERLGD